MQAITADTVITYITHDDRPNIQHETYNERQAGTERDAYAICCNWQSQSKEFLPSQLSC